VTSLHTVGKEEWQIKEKAGMWVGPEEKKGAHGGGKRWRERKSKGEKESAKEHTRELGRGAGERESEQEIA